MMICESFETPEDFTATASSPAAGSASNTGSANRATARPSEEKPERIATPSGAPINSLRQIVDRIDTLSGLYGHPIDTVSIPSPHPIDTVSARPKMANTNTVMSGEAGLHTTKHGLEIELRLPTLEEGQEYPPLMKFLAACMFRAEEELGWWEDQARWYDNYTKNKAFTKTRAQIRLVK